MGAALERLNAEKWIVRTPFLPDGEFENFLENGFSQVRHTGLCGADILDKFNRLLMRYLSSAMAVCLGQRFKDISIDFLR